MYICKLSMAKRCFKSVHRNSCGTFLKYIQMYIFLGLSCNYGKQLWIFKKMQLLCILEHIFVFESKSLPSPNNSTERVVMIARYFLDRTEGDTKREQNRTRIHEYTLNVCMYSIWIGAQLDNSTILLPILIFTTWS